MLKKIFTASLIFFMVGCATSRPPVNPNTFKNIGISELSERFARKELGRVELYTGADFDDYANVTIFRLDLRADVGNLKAGEGFILYLPEKTYSFWLSFGTTKAVVEHFTVKGGETVTYRWDRPGQKPYRVASLPEGVKILSSGSLYNGYAIDYHVRENIQARAPKFEIIFDQPQNGKVLLGLDIERVGAISKIYINGRDKSGLIAGGDFKFLEDVALGVNNFEVKLIDSQGYSSVKNIQITVLSDQEKREIAAKLREDQLRREQELLKQKLEEERVAREGDGSPDDLLCKKYGLRPQANGYAECRMRLDLAKAESKRQQELYERELAEYERRVAAIEKERERQRGLRFLELGSRMMAGERPIEALGNVGSGRPIAPSRPAPVMNTIILPGGRAINCTTVGAMTSCL